MAGKKKPYGVSNVVSWGAAVVIVGLLFKIQHWPYGGTFISIGLIAEALLFFILGFQREEKEIDWTRAYPELDESVELDPNRKVARPAAVAAPSFSSTAALDKMMSDAKIGPELINSLGEGLRTFGDKVNVISRVTDASEATINYTNKVKQATASYDNLSVAFEKASANLSQMADTNIDTKGYHDQVTALSKNLQSLNSVYERELADSSQHLQAMNSFYKNLSATMNNFNESLDDSKQFKEEVGRLAKNLASLNSVYGNMLTAMNQPRVS